MCTSGVLPSGGCSKSGLVDSTSGPQTAFEGCRWRTETCGPDPCATPRQATRLADNLEDAHARGDPAVESRTSDCSHRLGQEQPVAVYHLITRGTIEEKTVHLHATKRDQARPRRLGPRRQDSVPLPFRFHAVSRGGGVE